MPSYMIEYFVKKIAGKRRKWSCQSCISVSKEVDEANLTKDNNQVQTETINKLRREISACDRIAMAQRETINQQKDEI